MMLLTPSIPSLGAFVMAGCYRWDAVRTDITGVMTNKMATDAIRGAGPAGGDALHRGHDRPDGARARDRPARAAAAQLHPARRTFPYETAVGDGLRLGQLRRARSRSCSSTSTPRRSAAGRPTASCAAIGFSTWTEICGLAPSRATGPGALRRPGRADGVGAGARPRHRRGDRLHGHVAARPGARDELRPDRRRQARRRPAARRRACTATPRRARGASDTYGSRSLAVGGEAIARASDKVVEKVRAIVAHKLEAAPEDIELHDGTFSVKGSPGKRPDAGRGRRAGLHPGGQPARGHGAGPGGDVVLRPGELRVPVRGPRGGRGDRPRDRQGRPRPLRRGRRLRPGDQPDPDRRPGPRRHRARRRPGAVRAGRLRRERPARDGLVRLLRAAERRGAAELRDRPDGDPVAGQLARGQGHRRGGHDRRQRRRHERRDRRAPARAASTSSTCRSRPMRVWEALQEKGGAPA